MAKKNLKSLSPIWLFKRKKEKKWSWTSFFPSPAFWIVNSLSLFLMAQFSSWKYGLSFSFLYCLFLWFRFGSYKTIFIWFLMSGILMVSLWYHTSPPAQEGIYEVISIRSNYSLAQKDRSQVLVYETNVDLGDQLYLSNFQTIHSINNLGLFCFQQFLNQRGIYQNAQDVEHLKTYQPSWRRKVWQWIKKKQAYPFYQWLFYGISTVETPFGALGLPMMALTSVLRKRLERRFLAQTVRKLIFIWQGLLWIFFPFNESSLRLLVFELGRGLFSNWNERWSFQVSTFLLLNPYGARSMGFILPAGLSFFTHYQFNALGKKAMQIFWCSFCQIALLGQLNLVLLGGFLWMRSIFGWVVLATLPGLFNEAYGLFVWNTFQKLSWSWQWCTVTTYPPFWYIFLLGWALWRMAWKYQTRRMLQVLILLCFYPFIWKLDPFFHVYQLDVGQGDATVIVEPFQKSVIMIDAAGRFNHDYASEIYLPFFSSRQIDKLDALIISHSDFDHNGAVDSLKAKIPIATLITQSEETFSCHYAFELLLPNRTLLNEEENDKSLICAFRYDGFQYLWTGDASKAIEKQLLEHYSLQADIVKLGHHGSKTSSDGNFLRALQPSLALISSGYQNRYDHPNLEVLIQLNRLGIDRLNTADHGGVHLFSWHYLLGIETADGLFTVLSKS